MTAATSSVATHSVSANGIDIHYLEAGAPDLPPLVLLHGGLVSTSATWDQTPLSYGAHLDQLTPWFRVIAADTRGCGRTTHSGGPISMSLLADDVAALIDVLGLDRPALAGFSEGGLTATIFGIRHPGIARAIVNDAGYDMLNPEAPTFAMMRHMLGGSAEATVGDPDAAEQFFASDPAMRPAFELMRADQDAGGGSGHWRTYLKAAFDRTSTWPGYGVDDLGSIDAPCLILVGDRDHFCSVEEGVTAYRRLADGQLAVVPETGHVITAAKVNTMAAFVTGVS